MASQHTPSDRARRVFRLVVVGLSTGTLAMVFLQLWRATNNQFALYIGLAASVVTLLAILTQYLTAVAPQLRQFRRYL